MYSASAVPRLHSQLRRRVKLSLQLQPQPAQRCTRSDAPSGDLVNGNMRFLNYSISCTNFTFGEKFLILRSYTDMIYWYEICPNISATDCTDIVLHIVIFKGNFRKIAFYRLMRNIFQREKFSSLNGRSIYKKITILDILMTHTRYALQFQIILIHFLDIYIHICEPMRVSLIVEHYCAMAIDRRRKVTQGENIENVRGERRNVSRTNRVERPDCEAQD